MGKEQEQVTLTEKFVMLGHARAMPDFPTFCSWACSIINFLEQFSKAFIICLTNIKLVDYYFTTENYEECKKYFIKAIEKLKSINKFKAKTKFQQNENDTIYKFIFKNQKNDENTSKYPIDFFSYIKIYILNFPLFNLFNQLNLDRKDYSNILEQNDDHFEKESILKMKNMNRI